MGAGCAKVFKEKVSGAKTDRAELAKVIGRLEPDDVLVVTRLDRLARSTRDLLNVKVADSQMRLDPDHRRRRACELSVHDTDSAFRACEAGPPHRVSRKRANL
jgi:Resolvase, N terminal domain